MAEEKNLKKDPKRDSEIIEHLEFFEKLDVYEMMVDLKLHRKKKGPPPALDKTEKK